MSDCRIGDRVTTSASLGVVPGHVVGTGLRDSSANGTNDTVTHVCIAVVPPGDAWLWVPAAQCIA